VTFTALTMQTWATFFAGLAGVVTLFYLLRLRRRKVEVPYGPLWAKVLSEKQSTSIFRVLKRLFSLLVQLAIVALVLTAIADPHWNGKTHTNNPEQQIKDRRHTLLIIDTSASMAAKDVSGGRFDQAQQMALKVIEDMRPNEFMMIAHMARDTTAATDWTGVRRELKSAINELSVIDTTTNVESMMTFARNAVRGLPNAQVVLVTDRSFAPPNKTLARSISLKVVSVGLPTRVSNIAVLDFNVRSHLGNALQYAAYYKLKNTTKRPVKVSVFMYGDPDNTARTRQDFMKHPPLFPSVFHELAPHEERVFEREVVDLGGRRVALLVQPHPDIYVNARGKEAPYRVTKVVRGSRLRVSGTAKNHPLMKFVKFVDLEAPELLRIKKGKGSKVMARDRRGRAAIVANAATGKRWIAIGFDPIQSEWVGHYSFSIFFVNAINWFFAEDVKMYRPWSLAGTWDVKLPWKGLSHAQVVTPAGQSKTVLVDPSHVLVFTGTQTGFYEVSPADSDGRVIEKKGSPLLIAASLRSPEESNLVARGDYSEWHPLGPPEAQASSDFRLAGFPLWQILVLIALGLLLVEWLSFHRRWTV
jgi:hypothetical protein